MYRVALLKASVYLVTTAQTPSPSCCWRTVGLLSNEKGDLKILSGRLPSKLPPCNRVRLVWHSRAWRHRRPCRASGSSNRSDALPHCKHVQAPDWLDRRSREISQDLGLNPTGHSLSKKCKKIVAHHMPAGSLKRLDFYTTQKHSNSIIRTTLHRFFIPLPWLH